MKKHVCDQRPGLQQQGSQLRWNTEPMLYQLKFSRIGSTGDEKYNPKNQVVQHKYGDIDNDEPAHHVAVQKLPFHIIPNRPKHPVLFVIEYGGSKCYIQKGSPKIRPFGHYGSIFSMDD
jgi:hypothetical protein